MERLIVLEVTLTAQRAIEQNGIVGGLVVPPAVLRQGRQSDEGGGAGGDCEPAPHSASFHTGRSLPRTVSCGSCHLPGVFASCTIGASRWTRP